MIRLNLAILIPRSRRRRPSAGFYRCFYRQDLLTNHVGAIILRARIRTCAPHRNRLKALASMIHHIVLYKLKPEVTPARVEAMMMNARMQLLKIPEVLSIKCGKRVD